MKNVARLIAANVAIAEQLERDERMRPLRHEDREGDERDHADGQRDPRDGVLPRLLLAADHAEGEPADRERGDERAEPVEAPVAGRVA